MPLMLPPHGPASETAYTFHGPVGFAGSEVIHCTVLLPEKTASGLPSLFTSAKVIDSEMTSGEILSRAQRRDSPCGFTQSAGARDSATRMSSHPSPVKSPAKFTIAGL